MSYPGGSDGEESICNTEYIILCWIMTLYWITESEYEIFDKKCGEKERKTREKQLVLQYLFKKHKNIK